MTDSFYLYHSFSVIVAQPLTFYTLSKDIDMTAPKFSSNSFQFNLKGLQSGKIEIPQKLSNLFVEARSNYEWPEGIGAKKSQEIIIELEKFTGSSIKALSPIKAKLVVEKVSEWGGNNKNAQRDISCAEIETQSLMLDILEKIRTPNLLYECLERLSDLPGLRLVMATKVYRFCCPDIGAALDRHTSYFFNSLKITDTEGIENYCTKFKREWSTGKHKTSRLAIYQEKSHKYNLQIFIEQYLPILEKLSKALNEDEAFYLCKATNSYKYWRPCDVEMAAYYWWSKNGPR